MNDTIDSAKVTGEITLENIDTYHGDLDVVLLRARVGMVFQTESISKSVYENIAYVPRIHGMTDSKSDMDEIVETSLLRAGLWDEVKDRLNTLVQHFLRTTAKTLYCKGHSSSSRYSNG